MRKEAPIKIFFCYARKDKALRDELENHLAPLRRSGQITTWHDREILAGKEWKKEIDVHLNTSDIVLLLLSPNFMSSDYCYSIEMSRALERHKAGQARVIPIILRPAGWKATPLAELQALPRDGRPVTQWRNHDNAFENIVEGISDVVRELLTSTQVVVPPDGYRRAWTRTNPGYLVFLIDQSQHMSLPFDSRGERRMCDAVTLLLNSFLGELLVMHSSSGGVVPRVEVTALGYGGDRQVYSLLPQVSEKEYLTLYELAASAETEWRKVREIDYEGTESEQNVPFPVWIKPRAEGVPAMYTAFQRVKELVERWIVKHPDAYPPIVVHVTLGATDDGDPTEVAFQLRRVRTSDGQTLLYNVQIANTIESPTKYPSSENELPCDPLAKRLFLMSSLIPETSRSLLQSFLGRNTPPAGARGFIYSGEMSSIFHMYILWYHSSQTTDDV